MYNADRSDGSMHTQVGDYFGLFVSKAGQLRPFFIGWYLLATKSKNESRAAGNLANQGYETYCPQIEVEKVQQGVRKKVTEPLFPGYLFIQLDGRTASFNSIRSTRGVADFVRFGTQIATVPEALINRLKAGLVEKEAQVNEWNSIKPGDTVQINRGPFAGLKAVYHSRNGLERSVLLLTVIQQEQALRFQNSDFKKLDDQ